MKTASKVALAVVSVFGLVGCGSGTASTGTEPGAQAATQPVTSGAASGRDLSKVDPCSLLTVDDLRPVLSNTAPDPRKEGDVGCAWGDGEFRGVWLSFVAGDQPKGIRAITLGGKQGVVIEDPEYTCEVATEVDAVAITLRVAASDKVEWCQEATTALTAALTKLGW